MSQLPLPSNESQPAAVEPSPAPTNTASPAAPTPDRLAELIAHAPNLAVVALGFFLSDPLLHTSVMGNRHS